MSRSNQRSKTSVIGAILAGGASVRMGQPKNALRLPNGRTFAEAIGMALRPCCDEIVSLSPEQILPGVENIPDRLNNSGPLAGIEALLCSRNADRYLVCTCDQPLIARQVLEALLSEDSSAAVVTLQLKDAETIEHFPLLLRPEALQPVTTFLHEGRRDVGGFLQHLDPQVVRAPRSWRGLLLNINTSADFARLREE